MEAIDPDTSVMVSVLHDEEDDEYNDVQNDMGNSDLAQT